MLVPKALCNALAAIVHVLDVWASRARERRLLAEMSERSLKDIGLSSYDALHEYRKPFWRP